MEDANQTAIGEISISKDMVERVLAEWEKENPGKDATKHMGAEEFSRRMMIGDQGQRAVYETMIYDARYGKCTMVTNQLGATRA